MSYNNNTSIMMPSGYYIAIWMENLGSNNSIKLLLIFHLMSNLE